MAALEGGVVVEEMGSEVKDDKAVGAEKEEKEVVEKEWEA